MSEACHSCGGSILGRFLTVNGKKFHADHFTCVTCGVGLHGATFVEESGQFYCEKDYYSTLNLTCAGCQLPILSAHVTAMGKSWSSQIDAHTFKKHFEMKCFTDTCRHKDHFVCTTCSIPLGGGQVFKKRNGKPYCSDHFSEVAAEVCNGCGLQIHGSVYRSQDCSFHPNCFMCALGGHPIQGGFHQKDGKIYCPEHFKELFSLKCSGCLKHLTDKHVSAMGQLFHPECWQCSSCWIPLTEENCCFIENVFFCKKCGSSKLKANRSTDSQKNKRQVAMRRAQNSAFKAAIASNYYPSNNASGLDGFSSQVKPAPSKGSSSIAAIPKDPYNLASQSRKLSSVPANVKLPPKKLSMKNPRSTETKDPSSANAAHMGKDAHPEIGTLPVGASGRQQGRVLGGSSENAADPLTGSQTSLAEAMKEHLKGRQAAMQREEEHKHDRRQEEVETGGTDISAEVARLRLELETERLAAAQRQQNVEEALRKERERSARAKELLEAERRNAELERNAKHAAQRREQEEQELATLKATLEKEKAKILDNARKAEEALRQEEEKRKKLEEEAERVRKSIAGGGPQDHLVHVTKGWGSDAGAKNNAVAKEAKDEDDEDDEDLLLAKIISDEMNEETISSGSKTKSLRTKLEEAELVEKVADLCKDLIPSHMNAAYAAHELIDYPGCSDMKLTFKVLRAFVRKSYSFSSVSQLCNDAGRAIKKATLRKSAGDGWSDGRISHAGDDLRLSVGEAGLSPGRDRRHGADG